MSLKGICVYLLGDQISTIGEEISIKQQRCESSLRKNPVAKFFLQNLERHVVGVVCNAILLE